jgi:UDPglucose 6-dehydrogenase
VSQLRGPYDDTHRHYSCAVIGDWHNAFVTAACLAHLGHRTALVNPMLSGQSEWSEFPTLALREPHLPEIIGKGRKAGLLEHANGIGGHWTADFVWLAIDMPVDERDEPDLRTLLAAAERVASSGSARLAFVVSSQVPLGFCSHLEKSLGLVVACVPENLRLGRGVETFLRGDRLVVGATLRETAERVRALLVGLPSEYLACDLATAEMVKHATNAFLATSISFANELARIGETRGVDSQLVAAALKLDKRVGPLAYVTPGLGFAGGTLPRDLRVLQRLGRESATPTPLVDAVLEVNESTVDALVDAIRSHLRDPKGKTILVLGYTYKAETDTLRRSPSLELARRLVAEGARVIGYDPLMNGRDLSAIAGTIDHRADWGAVGRAPDVSIAMTPRSEFTSLAWSALTGSKRDPVPLVFDTRGIIRPASVLQAGFAFKALWQPARLP